MLPTSVNDVGDDAAEPGLMSLSIVVPAAVPSVTHNSIPAPSALPAKNIRPFTVLDRIPGYGIHEMGVARMGADPASSVVDADNRGEGAAGEATPLTRRFPPRPAR